MVGFLEPRKETINRWVDEAFSALGSIFSSRDDFVEYLNSLRNYEDAELLIRISQFYLVAKKYQPESYVKLIMIISAIEKLINRENRFQEFHRWVQKQDLKIQQLLSATNAIDAPKFKKIIQNLAEEYFQVFGSQRNVLAFFSNYFESDDKMKLARSMRANWVDTVAGYSERFDYCKQVMKSPVFSAKELEKYGFGVGKHLMPYCYDWRKCYASYGGCDPSIGCLLAEDESLQNKTLKKVVGLIYQMRNDFVHNALITPLNEKKSVFTLGRVGGRNVSIELTTEELESMFEKALKSYFDRPAN